MTTDDTGRTADLQILSVAELAGALGLAERTIWRMASRAELPPPIRLGARRLGWRRSSITAWLDDREAEALAAASTS